MFRTRHALVVATLAALCSIAARADVTLRQTTSGKVIGLNGDAPSVTYIKGSRMRIETQLGNKTTVSIFDVDAQKMYSFEAGKGSGDAWDMATIAAELGQAVDVGAISSTLKPNGQSRQAGGLTLTGYDLRVSVPAALGGPGGPKMTVTNEGTVWIAKGAPGSADYAAFYQGAATKGWIFSDPRVAKGQPGQAKAMADMYRQFAAAGGLPYEVDMKISVSGEGPMAAMMSSLGNSELRTTTQAVETGALADDLFAPPPGLKLKARK
ncbi:MAG: hypothetical protein MUF07_08275 [Steroidobacteraceae bacterium]|nr:hypothetical protein [Steroidobacteraceae bacterium]